MTSGQEFQNHTHACGTHDHDTVVLPVPVSHPIYICSEQSLLQYTQFVDQHACHMRKTPDFEEQILFGQLSHILLLELPSAPKLHLAEPTMVIVAVI